MCFECVRVYAQYANTIRVSRVKSAKTFFIITFRMQLEQRIAGEQQQPNKTKNLAKQWNE